MRKRSIVIISGAVVGALLLGLSQLFFRAEETISWGLHFPGEGQTPSGPADSRTLRQYDAVYIGDTTQKKLYLTFDAGYENGYTAQILDILKKHNVPAAFFVVGTYIERNADLVRRMVDEGHIVGNHTQSHPDMSKIADMDSFQKELDQVAASFQAVTGKQMPKFYRPPQGVYSEDNLKMAQKLGYRTIFWSLAYADWNNSSQPSREQAFQKLLPRAHNGAVILLHATSRTNAEILDELLTKWEQAGYEFAAIDTLFSA